MNNSATGEALLSVRNVHKHFRQRSLRGEAVNRAVDGVSLDLQEGEILGIAGESGCGKSTLARLLCGLVSPNSGERCIPVTKSCRSRLGDSAMPSITQRNSPYSARVPVTTQIFLVLIFGDLTEMGQCFYGQ